MLPPVEPPETDTTISYDKRLRKRDINKHWKIFKYTYDTRSMVVLSLKQKVWLW